MKLLWVSRLGYTCSYNQVSSDLLQHLRPEDELYVMTIGISPEENVLQNIERIYKIPRGNIEYSIVKYNMCCSEDKKFENLCLSGYHIIADVIRKFDPDVAIFLDDTGPLGRLSKGLKNLKHRCKLVAYVPIDCRSTCPEMTNGVFDAFITIMPFGKELLSQTVKKPIYVLPHIVDPSRFHIYRNPDLKILTVISVNANHIRKRWDLVFRAFFRFANKYGGPVRLLIKTNKLGTDPGKAGFVSGGPTDMLQDMQDAREIEKSSAGVDFKEGDLSNRELSDLYATADIGFNMSSCEGFGYTPIESSLFGVPQVVPDNTSFREIFPEYDYRVKTVGIPIYFGRHKTPKYVCMYKSYVLDKVRYKEQDVLTISPNVASYKIGPGEEFPSLEDFRNHLAKCVTLPLRFQVLCYLNYEFMKKQDWEKTPHILEIPERYNIHISRRVIEEFTTFNDGCTEIADIEDAANKLLMLADPVKRKSAGKRCKKLAMKYTPGKIGTQFQDILS